MYDFIPTVCISYVHVCVVFILWTHQMAVMCVKFDISLTADLCVINLQDWYFTCEYAS